MAKTAKARPFFIHQADALKVFERAAKDLTPDSFATFRTSLEESLDVAEMNAAQVRANGQNSETK